jgi:hypothetical protein
MEPVGLIRSTAASLVSRQLPLPSTAGPRGVTGHVAYLRRSISQNYGLPGEPATTIEGQNDAAIRSIEGGNYVGK